MKRQLLIMILLNPLTVLTSQPRSGHRNFIFNSLSTEFSSIHNYLITFEFLLKHEVL